MAVWDSGPVPVVGANQKGVESRKSPRDSGASDAHYGAAFGGMGMIIETRSLYRR